MSGKIGQESTHKAIHGFVDGDTYAGITSFMRCRYSRDLTDVNVAVWGVPYDLATTNRPGARFGPRAIRTASSNLAWERKAVGWGFSPFDEMTIVDYGDCNFDLGDPAKAPEEIYKRAREILETDAAILTLGGDHFVSYPLLRAHAEKHGPMSLIQFDAHSDTWSEESKRIDHGTMFYHAAHEGLVRPEQSAQIGLRTFNESDHGYHIFEARSVHSQGSSRIAKRVKEIVGDSPCYLTFDIDCLDPSCAPGTGTPVVGGLSTYQALQILQDLKGINLVGMDIVEVAPAYDVSEITSLAAATIALQQLCLFTCAKK